MNISLPQNKLVAIKNCVEKCSSGSNSLRSLASLLGKLVSAREGVLYAQLHYRLFQLEVIRSQKFLQSWDKHCRLTSRSILELSWWTNISMKDLIPVPLITSNPDITIYVDSSNQGYGIYLSNDMMFSGKWGLQDSKAHINYLELKTIYIALLKFSEFLFQKYILFRCDNNTAVCYFNKIGGTCSEKLCVLALKIWTFMVDNSILGKAEHIAGINNTAADYLSRVSKNHEYYILASSFEILKTKLKFSLEMDLFASKDNCKLDSYVSIFHDTNSMAQDAFSFIWPNNIYCFPPIPLVSKCLSKIQRDNVQSCLIITPAWHNLHYIPILIESLISDPIFIKSFHLVGPFPTRRPFHVMAWAISTSFVRKRAFQRKCQLRSRKVYPNRLSTLITGTGKSLLTGLREKSIWPIFL